jgi:hypothetical protein
MVESNPSYRIMTYPDLIHSPSSLIGSQLIDELKGVNRSLNWMSQMMMLLTGLIFVAMLVGLIIFLTGKKFRTYKEIIDDRVLRYHATPSKYYPNDYDRPIYPKSPLI